MKTAKQLTDAAVLAAPFDSITQDLKQKALRLVVSPKGKKVWEFYAWNPQTKKPLRKSLGLAGDDGLTVKQARAAAVEMAASLGKADPAPTKGSVPTFAEVIDAYCHPWVRRAFDRHAPDWLGKRLDAITREEVEARERRIKVDAGEESRWRDERAGKEPKANAGVHSVTNFGKAMVNVYKRAHEKRGYLGENMGERITQTPVEPRRIILKADERARFFAALDSPALAPWAKDAFLILSRSISRWGILLACRWEWVDLDAKRITIPGDKAKNREENYIELDDVCVGILKRRKAEAEKGNPWVFPSEDSVSGHIADISYQWRTLKALADLPADRRPHDIRRTGGSLLASDGESLAVIARLMNHKNIATTEKFYGHIQNEAKRRALDRLDRLLG